MNINLPRSFPHWIRVSEKLVRNYQQQTTNVSFFKVDESRYIALIVVSINCDQTCFLFILSIFIFSQHFLNRFYQVEMQEWFVKFAKCEHQMYQINPLPTNVSHHMENSRLICNADHLTGFYMIRDIGR